MTWLVAIILSLWLVNNLVELPPELDGVVVVYLQPVAEAAVSPEDGAMIVARCPADLRAGVAFHP